MQIIYINITSYITYNIKNKTFISKRVTFQSLPDLQGLKTSMVESSNIWKKPKYNSFRNVLSFYIY